MNHTVYLAGPISGLNFKGCTDWRDYAIAELAKADIKGLSPMRCKDYLKDIPELTADCKAYGALGTLSSPRNIMTRDRYDATRCDVLLVNLLGAKTVSIGTVMEIAWADLVRTPIVCAIEDENNLHEHAMINEAIGFRVPTLELALDVVKAILV